MKKNLISILSIILISSSCVSNNNLFITDELQEINTSSLDEKENQKLAEENTKSIEYISKKLFSEYFEDETSVDINKNDVLIENKGGFLFNLLNKSKIAQNIAYKISNYPVKAKFNKKGVPDQLPRINDKQINDLLSVLKEGDLILCGNDDSFVHAILYIGNGIIIHSLASKNPKFWGVVKEPLTQYLKRSERDKFIVLRPKNLDLNEFSKSVKYAESQVGKPYDTLFLINSESRFYCTELVYQSIIQMKNPPKIFPHKVKMGWVLVTNEDIMDSPDLTTVWTLNKQRPPVGVIHKY